MTTAAAAQPELPIAEDRTRCRRCGRDWTGILREPVADLVELMKRSPDEREAFGRCWTRTCTGRTGG